MKECSRIGVIGLGFMGRGIATTLLSHGYQVVAMDADSLQISGAMEHIDASLAEMVSEGLTDASFLGNWRGRWSIVEDLKDLGSCDYVIESAPEELNIKLPIYNELEKHLAPDTPIASNTSALPISELQKECGHPSRIVGMHWGEPCHLSRFLEVIRGEQTSQETIDRTVQLGRLLGKCPAVVERDVDGFIINRLAYAMYREAFWLLENKVADIETIDNAFMHAISVWGNIAGPFRWMDLTGVPAYAKVMARLFPVLSCEKEVPSVIRDIVSSGGKGIANGRGFYSYTPEEADQWRRKLELNVLSVRRFHEQWDKADE